MTCSIQRSWFDPQSTAHCASSHNGRARASASPRTGRPLWVSSRRIPISVEAVSTSSEVLPSRTHYCSVLPITLAPKQDADCIAPASSRARSSTRYAFVRFRVKASAILPAGKRTTGSAESPQLLPLSIQKSELACTCSACVEHVVSACFDRSFSSTMLA